MISIIIPTYNEADNIGTLIAHIKATAGSFPFEIIVSDGGSNDHTVSIANNAGVVVLRSPKKGRAPQMNFAASMASGSIFYFVHADTLPPIDFFQLIQDAVNNHFEVGRFQTKFDSSSLLFKLNAFFTRFDWFMCYGGDQTLFITRNLFEFIGGFNEEKLIMEDFDITQRAKEKGKYIIFKKSALVSVRKYEKNSWFRVQKANYTAVQLYKKGASSAEVASFYKNYLK
ncbi:MAG: TIGR04283 family arsenosugar biosynthesis glycosyltransferase [Ferruginibacter sp.]